VFDGLPKRRALIDATLDGNHSTACKIVVTTITWPCWHQLQQDWTSPGRRLVFRDRGGLVGPEDLATDSVTARCAADLQRCRELRADLGGGIRINCRGYEVSSARSRHLARLARVGNHGTQTGPGRPASRSSGHPLRGLGAQRIRSVHGSGNDATQEESFRSGSGERPG
jgi:hypothetical protein